MLRHIISYGALGMVIITAHVGFQPPTHAKKTEYQKVLDEMLDKCDRVKKLDECQAIERVIARAKP